MNVGREIIPRQERREREKERDREKRYERAEGEIPEPRPTGSSRLSRNRKLDRGCHNISGRSLERGRQSGLIHVTDVNLRRPCAPLFFRSSCASLLPFRVTGYYRFPWTSFTRAARRNSIRHGELYLRCLFKTDLHLKGGRVFA